MTKKIDTGVHRHAAPSVSARIRAAEERGYQRGYIAGERAGYHAGRDSAMHPTRSTKQTKRKRGAFTFEKFRASGRYVADLSKALPDLYETSTPGRVYAGGLVIERTVGCAEGQWMLSIANLQTCSNRFADLERELYEWGRDEGSFEDLTKQNKRNKQ